MDEAEKAMLRRLIADVDAAELEADRSQAAVSSALNLESERFLEALDSEIERREAESVLPLT